LPVFVLTGDGVISSIHMANLSINYEYHYQSLLLEDGSMFLFLDASETYLGCGFSYGQIIIWQIEEIGR
jgi:hypothetical protein